MKSYISTCLLLLILPLLLYSCSCSGDKDKDADKDKVERTTDDKEGVSGTHNSDPRSRIFYAKAFDKQKSYLVISKKNLNLSVYADIDGGTVLVARYPICLSKNKGQKGESGDMKTPESEPGEPFTITEIKDASTWCHDFGDGRGDILAYGAWFLRLSYGSGIGIHGSTNNRWSIPGSNETVPEGKTVGRDSEGCIRLLDEDIIHLHDNYAHLGQKVYIKTETQDNLSFENNIKNKNEEGKLINE